MYAVGTPAYQARIRRESKCAISDRDPVNVDLKENEFVSSSYDNTVLWISDVKLTLDDMERLKPGWWLNTSLMNAGQALFKGQVSSSTWLAGRPPFEDSYLPTPD